MPMPSSMSWVYYDDSLGEKGIEPSKITDANATEILGLCSRAFILLIDDGNVELAKIVFPAIVNK
jgi:hypothetical protein